MAHVFIFQVDHIRIFPQQNSPAPQPMSTPWPGRMGMPNPSPVARNQASGTPEGMKRPLDSKSSSRSKRYSCYSHKNCFSSLSDKPFGQQPTENFVSRISILMVRVVEENDCLDYYLKVESIQIGKAVQYLQNDNQYLGIS